MQGPSCPHRAWQAPASSGRLLSQTTPCLPPRVRCPCCHPPRPLRKNSPSPLSSPTPDGGRECAAQSSCGLVSLLPAPSRFCPGGYVETPVRAACHVRQNPHPRAPSPNFGSSQASQPQPDPSSGLLPATHAS